MWMKWNTTSFWLLIVCIYIHTGAVYIFVCTTETFASSYSMSISTFGQGNHQRHSIESLGIHLLLLFSLGEILRSRRDENRGHCTPFFSWAGPIVGRPVVVLMYTWIRWELFRMDGQVCLRQKEAGNFRERSSSSCRWVHQFLRGLTGPCSAGPLAGLFEPMIRTRPFMSHQKKKTSWRRRRRRTAIYNLHSFACVCSRSSTVVLPRKEICIHHLITPRHCWAVSLFFFSFLPAEAIRVLYFSL